jgi:hypothetical protein
MPKLGVGLNLSVPRVGGGAAPSGIAVGSVNSVIVANTQIEGNGTYFKRAGNNSDGGPSGGLNIGDDEYNASRPFFIGPTYYSEYSASKYYLFGPFTSGTPYGNGNSVSPQGVWKLYLVDTDSENGHTTYYLLHTSSGADYSILPTTGWSPSITITAA